MKASIYSPLHHCMSAYLFIDSQISKLINQSSRKSQSILSFNFPAGNYGFWFEGCGQTNVRRPALQFPVRPAQFHARENRRKSVIYVVRLKRRNISVGSYSSLPAIFKNTRAIAQYSNNFFLPFSAKVAMRRGRRNWKESWDRFSLALP